MDMGNTRMELVRRGQYAYEHRQYAYGQTCGLSWAVVVQLLVVLAEQGDLADA